MHSVRQEVQPEIESESAYADTYGGEAVSMSIMRKAICLEFQLQDAFKEESPTIYQCAIPR